MSTQVHGCTRLRLVYQTRGLFRSALISANLASSEEPRCLKGDSILVHLEFQDKPLFGCHVTFITFKTSAGLENPR